MRFNFLFLDLVSKQEIEREIFSLLSQKIRFWFNFLKNKLDSILWGGEWWVTTGNPPAWSNNLLENPERNVHMGVVSLTVKSIKWNYLSHICCSLGDQQTSTTEPAVSIKILWARFLNTLPPPNAWSKLVKGNTNRFLTRNARQGNKKLWAGWWGSVLKDLLQRMRHLPLLCSFFSLVSPLPSFTATEHSIQDRNAPRSKLARHP